MSQPQDYYHELKAVAVQLHIFLVILLRQTYLSLFIYDFFLLLDVNLASVTSPVVVYNWKNSLYFVCFMRAH